MPRDKRDVVAGQPHHITHRGHNRERVFTDSEDCEFKLWLLRKSSKDASCQVHAYALMGNHFHLIVTPDESDGLARMMHWAGTMYGKYFNTRYRRSGSVWEQPYKSFIIANERYFFACSKYIEMNPVRARMVDFPEQYKWSSFHCNGLGRKDSLITPHPLYTGLADDSVRRCAMYRSFFDSPTDRVILDNIQRGMRTKRKRRPEP